MTQARQLVLPFGHKARYASAAFLADESNAEAMAWLGRAGDWPEGRLALWGEEGRGKTHLLHAWAERNDAALLPGVAVRGLVHLPHSGGIAVDDADTAPEEPLLHLLNAAAEAGLPVLLSGRDAPARWPTRLPDLASRLRAILAAELRVPGDGMLRSLLARLLSDRQLAVAGALQEWLLLRLPRDPATLREAAARLDRIALAHGGRVTRPVAAFVLASFGQDSEDIVAESPPTPSLF